MKNLNLLYNKIYFRNIHYKSADKKEEEKPKIVADDVAVNNKMLFSYRFTSDDYCKCPIEDAKTFLLQTTYPGLLAGTGNPHDGSDDGEALKTGFSFDYTSGQPYIPGSSVKGTLRSYFRNHSDAVKTVCDQILQKNGAAPLQIKVSELEELIFEGDDVFFDAVVYWHDPYGELLSGDHITPHGKDVSKNPVPVKLLRLNPGVKLEFRFQLTDNGLEAKYKELLFYELLKLFGVGSKGNLGYGRLIDATPDRPQPKAKPIYSPTGIKKNTNDSFKNNSNDKRTQNKPQYSQSNRKYITCPHCKKESYRLDIYGNPRKTCSQCKLAFPDNYNK